MEDGNVIWRRPIGRLSGQEAPTSAAVLPDTSVDAVKCRRCAKHEVALFEPQLLCAGCFHEERAQVVAAEREKRQLERRRKRERDAAAADTRASEPKRRVTDPADECSGKAAHAAALTAAVCDAKLQSVASNSDGTRTAEDPAAAAHTGGGDAPMPRDMGDEKVDKTDAGDVTVPPSQP
jgi:hypothetical protein